jgi:hypothetical protein
MGECIAVGFIGIGVPVAAFVAALVAKPDNWQWWLIGSAGLMIALLFFLAGIPLDASSLPGDEQAALDAWGKVTLAFADVCGDWGALAFGIGVASGYAAGSAIKRSIG